MAGKRAIVHDASNVIFGKRKRGNAHIFHGLSNDDIVDKLEDLIKENYLENQGIKMLGVCSDFSRDIENMSFPESHMLLPVCDLVSLLALFSHSFLINLSSTLLLFSNLA